MNIEIDNLIIKFSINVIYTMKSYIQWNDNEAGGVLIGRQNKDNDNIVIEYITVPMENDIRSKFNYYRKDKNHLTYFYNLYESNHGIYAYYGEWHTHPEDFPRYSSIDLSNWKNISMNDSKEDQYHVIVGRKTFVVYQMKRNYNEPKLISEVMWNDKIL